MGIRFTCEHCGKRLNVKSFLAGKKGLCPKCGGRIRIPLEDQPVPQPVHSAALADAARQPLGESPQEVADQSPIEDEIQELAEAADSSAATGQGPWFVSPPGGGQYGPADRATVEQWIAEGRVSADTMVWREGWTEWQPAARHFVQFQFAAEPASQPVGPNMAEAHQPAPIVEGALATTEPMAPVTPDSTPRSYPRAATARKPSKQSWIWIAVFALLAILLLTTLGLVLMLQ